MVRAGHSQEQGWPRGLSPEKGPESAIFFCGDPAEKILESAAKLGTDLIVLGVKSAEEFLGKYRPVSIDRLRGRYAVNLNSERQVRPGAHLPHAKD